MRHHPPTHRRLAVVGLSLFALAFVTGAARAQTGAGSYAASFLKIPVGARLMSSPDAVAGLTPDASLMYSNPAFTAGLEHTQAFITAAEWLDDLTFSAAGVAVPIGGGSTVLGIGGTFLYSGGLVGYDDAMSAVMEQSYYNVGFDMTVSRTFRGTGFSAAVGATYLREHSFPNTGTGYAFHGGAAYRVGRNLFHLAARDLGGSVSYPSGTWSIAPEWMVGGGRVFDSSVGQFYAGGQVATSDAYGTRVQFGVDYQINTMFTLRTGLNDNLEDAQAQTPFNAGFGVRYNAFAIEYAYTPQEYFSSTHTFSLAYSFGMTGLSRRPPMTVPIGDTAPPVLPAAPAAPAPRATSARSTPTAFVLLAGSHSWLDSARSEVRALELLKIPSKVESVAGHYRVVVGRFRSYDEADAERQRYRSAGHLFEIVAE
jgi:SPOR domain